MKKQTKAAQQTTPLAYEVVPVVLDNRGRELTGEQYRYPVTGFTTPHLRSIRNHILNRDPKANVFPPVKVKKKRIGES